MTTDRLLAPLPEDSHPSAEFCEYLETLPDDQRGHVVELPVARYLSRKAYESLCEDIDFSELDLPGRAEAVSAKAGLQLPDGLEIFKARIDDHNDPLEVVAEAGYSQVLSASQERLGDAIVGERKLRAFFVPGVESRNEYDYARRLSRLAQDLGVRVVAKIHNFNNPETFQSFLPPQAASVEAYWAEQEGYVAAAEYKLRDERRTPLEELAALSPETLNAWPFRKQVLNNIRKQAYGSETQSGNDDVAARLILAKLNDPEGYEQLLQSVESGERIAPAFVDQPLGVYLQKDETRFQYFMERAKDMLTDDGIDPYAPLRYVMPLVYSCKSEAGVFLTNYLVNPAPNSDFAVRHGVQDYFRLTRDTPEHKINLRHFLTMQNNLTLFLAAQNKARTEGEATTATIYDALTAGDILLDWQRKVHKEVLGAHLLALYNEAGSVVTCRDGFSLANKWAQRYMRYRQQYGDLPEISQQIRIIGE